MTAPFPNFAALARAPLKSILKIWQGMGYNRRAVALKRIAQKVVTEFYGKLPNDVEKLKSLPGVGEATAGAVAAFAFNKPAVFVETNIRRVFIYFFFTLFNHINTVRSPQAILFGPRSSNRIRQSPQKLLGFAPVYHVSDQKILVLVDQTLDKKNPREWYWALMDYGAMLGRKVSGNPNKRSSNYCIQTKFEGSRRQMRGNVIRLLLTDVTQKNSNVANTSHFSNQPIPLA
ncbi:MAG: hypothetical protein AB1352_05485 [Patescibacteria group bacterium]